MKKKSKLVLYPFAIVLLGAVGVPLIEASPAIWGYLPTFDFTRSFLPESLAGIIGVNTGFGLNELSLVRQMEKRVSEMKSILRRELEQIRKRLSAPDKDTLAEQIPYWTQQSMVSLGHARLLELELQRRLDETYSTIDRS